MSGVLNAVAAVSSAVSQIFGGGGNVTIGSVTLLASGTGFPEVPDRISWSGHQRIARRALPGGDIIAHAMGIDYPPIEWKGVLLQANAVDRARQLYAMMQQGDPVELSWFDHDYSVLVEKFEPTDLRENWVEYSICCQVLEDLAGESTIQPVPGLLDSVTGDIGDALGVTLPTMAQVQTAIGQVQTVLAPINALTGGALTGVQGALATAGGAIATVNSLANTALGAAQGLAAAAGTVFPPLVGGAAAAAASVTAVIGNVGTLAAGSAAAAYVGRAVTNTNAAAVPPIAA